MAYDLSIISDQFPDDEDSENSLVGLNCAPPETDHAAPALRRLRPNPYRSLGGFLNYEGWPDCERLMELDRAIQSQAQKHDEDWDDSENPAAPHRVHRPSAGSVGGTSGKNRFQPTTEYVGSKGGDHRSGSSGRNIVKELEDLNIRRL
jgi:hypothetical protein